MKRPVKATLSPLRPPLLPPRQAHNHRLDQG